jgi:hypothetical protein
MHLLFQAGITQPKGLLTLYSFHGTLQTLSHLNVLNHHVTRIKQFEVLLSDFRGNKFVATTFQMFKEKNYKLLSFATETSIINR